MPRSIRSPNHRSVATDGILVGARENDLGDVPTVIPQRRITVFTGVSGSGMSSLDVDTIATSRSDAALLLVIIALGV